MADVSRDVAKAAREWADQQTTAITSLPAGMYVLNVAATSPLSVSWRNRTVLVAGKNAAYTPVVADRVRCSVVDDQLFIDYPIG